MKNETMKKYPALNTIAVLVGIFARIVIGISILSMLCGGALSFTDYSFSRLAGLMLLGGGLAGIVFGFFLLVYAESIKVVVDIEANTRESADALALIAKNGYNTQKVNQ